MNGQRDRYSVMIRRDGCRFHLTKWQTLDFKTRRCRRHSPSHAQIAVFWERICAHNWLKKEIDEIWGYLIRTTCKPTSSGQAKMGSRTVRNQRTSSQDPSESPYRQLLERFCEALEDKAGPRTRSFLSTFFDRIYRRRVRFDSNLQGSHSIR